MNASDYKFLNNGFKSFTASPLFNSGTNTFSKSNNDKSILSKSSTANAATEFMDLGQFPPGTVISFCAEVRATSLAAGAPSISIESRTGPSLSAGRKIVNLAQTTSTEWVAVRCDWIVSPGENWIALAYGASTSANGTFEFRRPRVEVKNSAYDKQLCCNLVRSSGVWSIDTTNFVYSGIELVSASGDFIEIKWPYTPNMAPIVQVTVDTGFSLTTAGFVSAGPNTVTNSGCRIKLIKADGTFATDVKSGGTVRINVSVTP